MHQTKGFASRARQKGKFSTSLLIFDELREDFMEYVKCHFYNWGATMSNLEFNVNTDIPSAQCLRLYELLQ